MLYSPLYRDAQHRAWRSLELVSVALWVVLAAACAKAEVVSGIPRVLDGDSLEIADVSVRLFGIDAPEGRQTCTRAGEAWRCGDAAANALRRAIGTQPVVCERRDTDAYGRMVARCTAGGTDLAAELTLRGYALAYRQFSNDYVDEEAAAQAAGRGIWASEFVAPWDWRRSSRAAPAAGSARSPQATQSSEPVPAEACTIKGNINREGARIFHVPGSRSYEQTRIDTSRGERWFCSVEEAREAGWRAPRG
jgi:endonuclease YncB( thermonuclease family)